MNPFMSSFFNSNPLSIIFFAGFKNLSKNISKSQEQLEEPEDDFLPKSFVYPDRVFFWSKKVFFLEKKVQKISNLIKKQYTNYASRNGVHLEKLLRNIFLKKLVLQMIPPGYKNEGVFCDTKL